MFSFFSFPEPWTTTTWLPCPGISSLACVYVRCACPTTRSPAIVICRGSRGTCGPRHVSRPTPSAIRPASSRDKTWLTCTTKTLNVPVSEVVDDGQAQEGARERRSKMVADVIAIQWYSMRDCQRMMVQWWLCLSRHQFPSMPQQLQQGRDYLGCIAMWLSVHSNFRESSQHCKIPGSSCCPGSRWMVRWEGGRGTRSSSSSPSQRTVGLPWSIGIIDRHNGIINWHVLYCCTWWTLLRVNCSDWGWGERSSISTNLSSSKN